MTVYLLFLLCFRRFNVSISCAIKQKGLKNHIPSTIKSSEHWVFMLPVVQHYETDRVEV